MSSPTRLGRYVVRRRIGSGGFATVWLCYDEQLDSPVAVKVLADNWAGDHHVRQRFVEEGRFLRKVDSPHVVPVYDFGELDDERPYLVMAYADQGNLADRLDLAPLRLGQAVQVVQEVGAGLSALHHRNVLHRDVKPANVLFRSLEGADAESPRVRAMLGDLGLGKALDMSSRLTMVGGTPAYVAPEQARGEHMDARSDQYSLGALTYQLLTGRAAHQHASLAAAGSPPPLESLGEGFPAEVDAVVHRALSPDPGDRWPDVATYVRELSRALSGEVDADRQPTLAWLPADPGLTRAGARPSLREPRDTAPTAQVPGPARRRRVLPWLVAGVVALGIGGAGGWLAGGQLPTDVQVTDDNGNLSVTVPDSWAVVRSTAPWTPPGAEGEFSALSVGSSRGWQQASGGTTGVFAGILPGRRVPEELPGHPECDTALPGVSDDGGETLTVTHTGCPGGTTTIERVSKVADERLVWVQVRSADRASAVAALDSVEVSGF